MVVSLMPLKYSPNDNVTCTLEIQFKVKDIIFFRIFVVVTDCVANCLGNVLKTFDMKALQQSLQRLHYVTENA